MSAVNQQWHITASFLNMWMLLLVLPQCVLASDTPLWARIISDVRPFLEKAEESNFLTRDNLIKLISRTWSLLNIKICFKGYAYFRCLIYSKCTGNHMKYRMGLPLKPLRSIGKSLKNSYIGINHCCKGTFYFISFNIFRSSVVHLVIGKK